MQGVLVDQQTVPESEPGYLTAAYTYFSYWSLWTLGKTTRTNAGFFGGERETPQYCTYPHLPFYQHRKCCKNDIRQVKPIKAEIS